MPRPQCLSPGTYFIAMRLVRLAEPSRTRTTYNPSETFFNSIEPVSHLALNTGRPCMSNTSTMADCVPAICSVWPETCMDRLAGAIDALMVIVLDEDDTSVDEELSGVLLEYGETTSDGACALRLTIRLS